jgi:glycine oxidase
MKVVVIGGGIAGLSIGWRLVQQGAEVTVLERAQPGMGATWASAGMIAVTAENGDENSPEAKLGRASAALWPAFAAEVEEKSGRKIGFEKPGTVIVARNAEESAQLAVRAKNAPSAKMMSADEARALEPMLKPGIAGALFDPDEAQIDNRAIGLALAKAFVRAGGSLQSNEAVVRIEMENGRAIGARTPFSHHHADAFVLAAGAWTAQIEGLPKDAVPPVFPVKGEMLALDPPDGVGIPHHAIWGNEIYLVPRLRRLFVGATVARNGFDTTPTDDAEEWLFTRALGLLPQLDDWKISDHWAGLRPGSPDNLPLLGATTVANVFVASGQYRNGILLAPSIAEALCSLVLGRSPSFDIRVFDPRRFADHSLAKVGASG